MELFSGASAGCMNNFAPCPRAFAGFSRRASSFTIFSLLAGVCSSSRTASAAFFWLRRDGRKSNGAQHASSCRSGIRQAECINTRLRTMYLGAASSILTACMMCPARFAPLQLLPTQYLLPYTSCALWIFVCTQVDGRMLGLLWLWRIALGLRLRARAARTLLLRFGRALSLEWCFAPLHAMRRLRVLSRMLPSHMHSQGVPRVERFATILAARPLEDSLLCGGRRRTSDVAHVLK